jgi:hypothetical protein
MSKQSDQQKHAPGCGEETAEASKGKRGRRRKGMCLEDRPLLEPNAAGIDIGAREIFVAVPLERDENPVRVFSTFTEDLDASVVKSLANSSGSRFWSGWCKPRKSGLQRLQAAACPPGQYSAGGPNSFRHAGTSRPSGRRVPWRAYRSAQSKCLGRHVCGCPVRAAGDLHLWRHVRSRDYVQCPQADARNGRPARPGSDGGRFRLSQRVRRKLGKNLRPAAAATLPRE